MARQPPQQTVIIPTNAFPQTTGYDVNDRPLVAPSVFMGKPTVLFVSFTIDVFPVLEAWEAAFQRKYGARGDLNHYVMPVLAGFTQVLKNIATPNIIKNVPEKKFGAALFGVYGDSVPIVNFLKVKDMGQAYAVVLNDQAQLKLCLAGEPTASSIEQLEAALK